MIPLVGQLLASIEQQWHACHYDERRFTDIATAALEGARLCEHLNSSDLVRWFNHEPGAAPQVSLASSFGEPALTLASTSRFYIEALFWLDGTTSIHQHRFSGAFMVLEGSSIHSRYKFERSQRVNATTEIGALALERVECLRPGQVRPIRSGSGTIHSLFHLERPTLSIVARTTMDQESGPQLDYWPPCVARDPAAIDSRLTRQLQLIRTLSRVAAPDRFQHANELLQRSDFGSSLMILDTVVASNADAWPAVLELIAVVHARHPEVTCDLVPVFAERRRINLVVSRRQQVHDPELRLFLAMLLNLPTQTACLEFLRTYAPNRDPEALISEWIDRLGLIESTAETLSLLFRPLGA
ncbi:MAG: hypothetical protein M3680_00135 [Myxococcota bacterium]|nr:hypothetical protein [Myxococcota bacterium]